MDDRQALEYYKDEANQAPAGPAYRRQRPRLSATTPVRFPQEMINAIKRFAVEDGVTVSAWIRRVIAREIQRRQPPRTSTAGSLPPVSFDDYAAAPRSATVVAEEFELLAAS